jgi:hypothetical protein
MTTTRPVLIVGAGPTGMTAAIELNRFGIQVRLIDKLLEPVTTSRATVVQARTLELFEQRGLADAMLEAGNKGIAASAKTLFLEGILDMAGKKGGVYFDGSNTTNRILDVLEQERPTIICIDELDKMSRTFQNELLNFMESGRVKVDQQRINRHPDVSYKEFNITRFRNLNFYLLKILICWHTNWSSF